MQSNVTLHVGAGLDDPSAQVLKSDHWRKVKTYYYFGSKPASFGGGEETKFTRETAKTDAALLEFEKPWKFDNQSNVYPACLMDFEKKTFEHEFVAVGYGKSEPVTQSYRTSEPVTQSGGTSEPVGQSDGTSELVAQSDGSSEPVTQPNETSEPVTQSDGTSESVTQQFSQGPENISLAPLAIFKLSAYKDDSTLLMTKLSQASEDEDFILAKSSYSSMCTGICQKRSLGH